MAAAWLINVVVAEWIIRRRPAGSPRRQALAASDVIRVRPKPLCELSSASKVKV